MLDLGHWSDVRPLLDEDWYVKLDPEERRQRTFARYMRFGMSVRALRDWVACTEEPNALLIAAQRASADLIVRLPTSPDRAAGLRTFARILRLGSGGLRG